MRRFLRRFEVVPGMHKPHPFRNGVIFLVLVAFGLYCGYTRDVPLLNEGGTEVRAEFAATPNLITGNRVRIKGVDVGEVKKIERDGDGRGVIVEMKLKDDKIVPIRRDARASLYWRTLLGRNMYIELEPGSPSAPELGDATIPAAHTTSQVEFDQFLSSFDPDARKGVQTFFREFDKGFREPEQVGRALDELDPAMRSAAAGVPAMRGTRPGQDLPELVDSASRTLGALSRSESDLAGLIDHGSTALAVTAARRQDIGAMLDTAPAALSETRTTMARTRTTLDELDPVADDLRPGVRELDDAVADTRPALREATSLLPQAIPTLKELRPALRDLRTAANTGVPLLRDLEPTLARTEDDIVPWLEKTDDRTNLKNAWAIGPFFSSVASITSTFDGDGHHVRFQPGAGLSTVGENPICNEALARGVDKDAACEAIVGTLYGALGMRPKNLAAREAARYYPGPQTNKRAATPKMPTASVNRSDLAASVIDAIKTEIGGRRLVP